MYNFYQSNVRKEINEVVYKKPVVYFQIFEKEYQGIIREKKIFWKNFRWIQFLWVNWLTVAQMESMKRVLKDIKKHYWPIFVQIWFTDVLQIANHSDVENGVVIENIVPKREESQNSMKKLWFIKTCKENLPPSTYIINTSDQREKLRWRLSSYHKSKIKKAVSENIICSIAETKDEIEDFFNILQSTGQTKWFHTVTRKNFDDLMNWCNKNNAGYLYVAKKNWKIVWWSVYLVDNDAQTGIYLYWATDRNIWNIGIWRAVNWFAICHLQDIRMQTIDLLWWGPIWDKKHPLYWVGLFKEGFWGEKVEFVWSYDIVYQIFPYLLWKFKNRK